MHEPALLCQMLFESTAMVVAVNMVFDAEANTATAGHLCSPSPFSTPRHFPPCCRWTPPGSFGTGCAQQLPSPPSAELSRASSYGKRTLCQPLKA
jgi:hypothetical protein